MEDGEAGNDKEERFRMAKQRHLEAQKRNGSLQPGMTDKEREKSDDIVNVLTPSSSFTDINKAYNNARKQRRKARREKRSDPSSRNGSMQLYPPEFLAVIEWLKYIPDLNRSNCTTPEHFTDGIIIAELVSILLPSAELLKNGIQYARAAPRNTQLLLGLSLSAIEHELKHISQSFNWQYLHTFDVQQVMDGNGNMITKWLNLILLCASLSPEIEFVQQTVEKIPEMMHKTLCIGLQNALTSLMNISSEYQQLLQQEQLITNMMNVIRSIVKPPPKPLGNNVEDALTHVEMATTKLEHQVSKLRKENASLVDQLLSSGMNSVEAMEDLRGELKMQNDTNTRLNAHIKDLEMERKRSVETLTNQLQKVSGLNQKLTKKVSKLEKEKIQLTTAVHHARELHKDAVQSTRALIKHKKRKVGDKKETIAYYKKQCSILKAELSIVKAEQNLQLKQKNNVHGIDLSNVKRTAKVSDLDSYRSQSGMLSSRRRRKRSILSSASSVESHMPPLYYTSSSKLSVDNSSKRAETPPPPTEVLSLDQMIIRDGVMDAASDDENWISNPGSRSASFVLESKEELVRSISDLHEPLMKIKRSRSKNNKKMKKEEEEMRKKPQIAITKKKQEQRRRMKSPVKNKSNEMNIRAKSPPKKNRVKSPVKKTTKQAILEQQQKNRKLPFGGAIGSGDDSMINRRKSVNRMRRRHSQDSNIDAPDQFVRPAKKDTLLLNNNNDKNVKKPTTNKARVATKKLSSNILNNKKPSPVAAYIRSSTKKPQKEEEKSTQIAQKKKRRHVRKPSSNAQKTSSASSSSSSSAASLDAKEAVVAVSSNTPPSPQDKRVKKKNNESRRRPVPNPPTGEGTKQQEQQQPASNQVAIVKKNDNDNVGEISSSSSPTPKRKQSAIVLENGDDTIEPEPMDIPHVETTPMNEQEDPWNQEEGVKIDGVSLNNVDLRESLVEFKQSHLDDLMSTIVQPRPQKGFVFGISLEATRKNGVGVPWILHELTKQLCARGMGRKGLFRIACKMRELEDDKNRIQDGRPVDFNKLNVDVCANMLKMWLMDLPEPVCTFDGYDKLCRTSSIKDEKKRDQMIRTICGRLPFQHKLVFGYLVSFMKVLASFSDKNQMTANNLATVFAPTLCRSRDVSTQAFASIPYLVKILNNMICKPEKFFASRELNIMPHSVVAPKSTPMLDTPRFDDDDDDDDDRNKIVSIDDNNDDDYEIEKGGVEDLMESLSLIPQKVLSNRHSETNLAELATKVNSKAKLNVQHKEIQRRQSESKVIEETVKRRHSLKDTVLQVRDALSRNGSRASISINDNNNNNNDDVILEEPIPLYKQRASEDDDLVNQHVNSSMIKAHVKPNDEQDPPAASVSLFSGRSSLPQGSKYGSGKVIYAPLSQEDQKKNPNEIVIAENMLDNKKSRRAARKKAAAAAASNKKEKRSKKTDANDQLVPMRKSSTLQQARDDVKMNGNDANSEPKQIRPSDITKAHRSRSKGKKTKKKRRKSKSRVKNSNNEDADNANGGGEGWNCNDCHFFNSVERINCKKCQWVNPDMMMSAFKDIQDSAIKANTRFRN